MIKDRKIDYYDFNLCKEEYIPSTSEIFKDYDHLNGEGAKIFSRIFARFVNGEISSDDLFYDSFNEKIDVTDTTQVLQYGASAQNKISKFSF